MLSGDDCFPMKAEARSEGPTVKVEESSGDSGTSAVIQRAPSGAKRARNIAKGPQMRRIQSQYRGVTHHCRTGRFEAHIWDSGKQVYLGGFDTEQEAALAYDVACVRFRGEDAQTNFDIRGYAYELRHLGEVTKEEVVQNLRRQSKGNQQNSSQYRGVTLHQKGKWEARIGTLVGRKYKYLGLFTREVEAAQAYDKESVRRKGLKAITNFDISEYLDLLSMDDIENLKQQGRLKADGSPQDSAKTSTKGDQGGRTVSIPSLAERAAAIRASGSDLAGPPPPQRPSPRKKPGAIRVINLSASAAAGVPPATPFHYGATPLTAAANFEAAPPGSLAPYGTQPYPPLPYPRTGPHYHPVGPPYDSLANVSLVGPASKAPLPASPQPADSESTLFGQGQLADAGPIVAGAPDVDSFIDHLGGLEDGMLDLSWLDGEDEWHALAAQAAGLSQPAHNDIAVQQQQQQQQQGELQQAMRHRRTLSREEQEMAAVLEFFDGEPQPVDFGTLDFGEAWAAL